MNKTELVQKVLTEMGFRPEIDDDGDVIFCHEMKTMYVVCRYEEEFLNVIYPNYFELDDDEQYAGIFLCMKETRETKHIKTFLDNDLKNVSSSAEFWYLGEDDLKNSLEKAIMVLGCARSKFVEDMKELMRMKEDESADEEDFKETNEVDENVDKECVTDKQDDTMEDKNTYDVVLVEINGNGSEVAKAIGESGRFKRLNDVMRIIENCPAIIKKNLSRDMAEKIKKAVEKAGGIVEIK